MDKLYIITDMIIYMEKLGFILIKITNRINTFVLIGEIEINGL